MHQIHSSVLNLVKFSNKQWCGKLFVQNTNTKEHLNIMVFHHHLHKIFQCNGKELEWNENLDEDKITRVHLEGNNIHVTYDITNNKLVDVNF